jgi:hypothetical protein
MIIAIASAQNGEIMRWPPGLTHLEFWILNLLGTWSLEFEISFGIRSSLSFMAAVRQI